MEKPKTATPKSTPGIVVQLPTELFYEEYYRGVCFGVALAAMLFVALWLVVPAVAE